MPRGPGPNGPRDRAHSPPPGRHPGGSRGSHVERILAAMTTEPALSTRHVHEHSAGDHDPPRIDRPQVPGHPGHRRRIRGHRLRRDPDQRGRLRLPDHPVDDDGRRLPGRRRQRAAQPVGHAARASSSRRSEHSSASAAEGFALAGGRVTQLHRRPGPDPDEGGPVRHRRQAPAGRLPRRRPRADQPGAEHPRRPRRRDGRRRHRLGHPVRPQRAGGGRPDRDRPARRRGDRDAVHRRARTAS